MHVKSTACVCLLVLFAACGQDTVHVSQAWIGLPAPDSSMLAGYLVIENNSGEALSLEGVSSDAFASISLHQSMIKNGIATMKPVRALRLPAGAKVVMRPGGLHLMLMNPDRHLSRDDVVTLNFEFSNGTVLPVKFTVQDQVTG